MVTPRSIADIDELVPDYDLFLFDQYGVLHDGRSTYPGIVDCISRIKAAGKSIGVISNSGKRAEYNALRLSRFGFGPELIDRVITSGEVAWNHLNTTLCTAEEALTVDAEPATALPDKSVFYVGSGADRSAIEGLPLTETTDLSQCDVLMITGCEPEQYELEDYASMLRPAAQRGVPAFCTNPDRWALSGAALQFGPGQIATEYHSMGGEVTWIGKPHAQIYEYALSTFSVAAERTICVGDSVEHDIAGAAAAGCLSVLVATGILAELSAAELQTQFSRFGATPDFVIKRA